jgi:hypothetical protein
VTASRKVYLGDSVYVAFDGYHVVVTTENGLGPSNTIFLDPNVRCALMRVLAAPEKMIRELGKEVAEREGPPFDAATATGMYDPEG